MLTPHELQILYEKGENITELLRHEKGIQYNTDEIIEIAYDLQSGSYIAAMEKAEIGRHITEYTSEIAKTILSLCDPVSILEAGIGEATTLSGVLQNMEIDVSSYGFDLSWSRVAYAKRWLQDKGITSSTLCTGNLFHMPFADNSVDVVYTSHSIEPNGGNEKPILRELFRVARKFVILLEPGYELASEESRRRMDSHGYCKDLKGIADSLGYEVLRHDFFPVTSNPINPTAITIIKKNEVIFRPAHVIACPKFNTSLEEVEGMMFSPEALVVYPILGGIPCLRIENGIFASKYKEVMARG